ncbi:MAG TPA: prenyltransferase/squalene oxidase repeat-containing protein [Terriglobales bacterium]|nr:prenyltransferase/squalene oxidase repeat-containing protein [Terriglobales bacterium]
MTEHQSKPEPRGPKIVYRQAVASRRSTQESITVGLEYIFASREEGHWKDFSTLGEGQEVWVTACCLTRLAEVPASYISGDFRLRMEESLDWLMQARRNELWSAGEELEADADTTAWAVVALQRHGRKVPADALEFIRRCQRPNGGFAAYPESSDVDAIYKLSAPDTTVMALKALGTPNAAAEEFLASRLQTDTPGSWYRLASRFQLWSEMLDMEEGLVSWFLLNRVSQSTAQDGAENAFEKSLLLRCLFRLRMQRAWAEAAALRNLQLLDGSWPGSAKIGPAMPGALTRQKAHTPIIDDKRILTTVSAVSALVMGESQPGLYFGSDRPHPRRFNES